ncbi:hypothetical protein MMC09_006142 [Bachmanniomyces sp. S44760]|nr:hypothetical protein [Bachmanniomyces sp. S44760]
MVREYVMILLDSTMSLPKLPQPAPCDYSPSQDQSISSTSPVPGAKVVHENDELDDIAVDEILTGREDDCEVTLSYNSTRFIVLVKRPSPAEEDTIEGKLLRELDDAAAISDEAVDRCTEKINDFVISECKFTIHKLAPVSCSIQTLQDQLYPKSFILQLVTTQGKLGILEHSNPDLCKYRHSPAELDPIPFLSVDTLVPMIPAAELCIVKNLHFSKVVEVKWSHDTYAFKTAFPGGEAGLRREIQILQTLERGLIHNRPRIPRLRGLVVSNGKIVGFLEEIITECCMLGRMDMLSVPQERRVKWALTIRETLQALHQIGLAWGDAKADNILVDGEGEPWMVDFGGSFTPGWVKWEDKETIGRPSRVAKNRGLLDALSIIYTRSIVYRQAFRGPHSQHRCRRCTAVIHR